MPGVYHTLAGAASLRSCLLMSVTDYAHLIRSEIFVLRRILWRLLKSRDSLVKQQKCGEGRPMRAELKFTHGIPPNILIKVINCLRLTSARYWSKQLMLDKWWINYGIFKLRALRYSSWSPGILPHNQMDFLVKSGCLGTRLCLASPYLRPGM